MGNTNTRSLRLKTNIIFTVLCSLIFKRPNIDLLVDHFLKITVPLLRDLSDYFV